jgi:hypothetical protein
MKRAYFSCRWLIALVVALSAGNSFAAEPPGWLLGAWQLNNELTAAAQVKKKDSSSGGFGNMSTTVSIGGIPLPGAGSSAQPGPGGSAKDPEVLRCHEMQITSEGEDLLFDFTGVGKERVKRGNNQGRVTKWNRSKLTSRYQTTSRKVERIYQLQKDATLMVTVKIKPRQAAKIVQKRVFQRPTAATAADAAQSPPG